MTRNWQTILNIGTDSTMKAREAVDAGTLNKAYLSEIAIEMDETNALHQIESHLIELKKAVARIEKQLDHVAEVKNVDAATFSTFEMCVTEDAARLQVEMARYMGLRVGRVHTQRAIEQALKGGSK